MMSRYFRLSSEPSGAIAKRLPHAKNQLSVHHYASKFLKLTNLVIFRAISIITVGQAYIISHIINQCDPRRLRQTQSVPQPRSEANEARLYIYIHI